MENIQFRLVGVKTIQFVSIDVGEVLENDVTISSDYGYGLNVEDGILGCQYKGQLFKKDLFIMVEVSCLFAVKQTSLKKLKVKNKKQYRFPSALIRNFTEITVSTARGVLHEKTVGNQYQKFILPVVDTQDIIKEDLIIEY